MLRLSSLLGLLALAASLPALALEFGSASRPAILYESSSATSSKVAIVSSGYPLEKIVAVGDWIKIRDPGGVLGWIESEAFSTKRTLLVNAAIVNVMEKPRADAPVLFRAQQGLLLDLVSPVEGGWAKVRHVSGQEGYIKISGVWGL